MTNDPTEVPIQLADGEVTIAEPIYVTRARDLRQQAGLTLVQLSVAAGVSTGVLQRMETAEEDSSLSMMGVDKFIKVADALNTTPASIYPRLHNNPNQKEKG